MARPRIKRAAPAPAVSKATPTRKPRDDVRFNTALARGLSILRAFRPGEVYLGNVELSERTGIPNSTISRFTYTLQELGYLRYVENLGRYQLGPSVFNLGYAVLSTIDLHVLARSQMAELATASGGVVSFAALDELEMVYIEVAKSDAYMMRNNYVGLRVPVAYTSLGWACLSTLETDDLEKTLKRLERALGADWPQTRTHIQRALRDVDRKGFCQNFGGQSSPSTLNACAVPVRQRGDFRHYAINLIAPTNIISKTDIMEKWGPALVALSKSIGTDS